MQRPVRLAATEGFRPDHVGASSQTDATAAPASLTPPASGAPSAGTLLPYFVSFYGYLRDHASSLAQHLNGAEHASFFPILGLGLGPHAARDARSSAAEARSEGGGAIWQLLPLSHHMPHLQPPLGFGSRQEQQQQQQRQSAQQHELQDPQHQQHADDGHFWVGPILTHLPWSHEASLPSSNPSGPASVRADVGSPAPPSSSSAPSPTASQPLDCPSDLHHQLAAHTTGLTLLWHAALVLQQRALMTALWRMGQAVDAAEKARRNLPPPAEVPALAHWAAVAAAARAEEAVALALAHTVTAAASAAAGVPAAAAAVTGGATATAASAAAVTAPHLPLLRHARRRLLAAATPMLERLRDLQRGCTTHVLLRFLLFSALKPTMRRDLRVRLDVLARRAAQVALLQEQHDIWVARQTTTSSSSSLPAEVATSPASTDAASRAAAAAAAPTRGESAEVSAAGVSGSGATAASPLPAPLPARWYRRVFAPEMLACARQLEVEAPGSPPDDRAAGDPPGRFDLRDLYRLIRVIEVALEDLERYE